ncbi:MAG TPA: hypothetical protein VJB90_04670 [Candidatus Nanoarchaeia archaeon]|nr:hypothetical protein [Candidatus Nanoarchaeia archaeon]
MKGRILRWGNSIGIRLNIAEAREAGIYVNDEVEIEVKRKLTTVKDVFGSIPKRKDTDKILKEIDDFYGER